MDVGRFKKPIHFTCPKCHADFEFAGGEIVKRKNEVAHDVALLLSAIQKEKAEHGKTTRLKRLNVKLSEKQAELQRMKTAVQIASEQSELHLFILFKKECMKRFGEEVIVKMLEECEQELSYRVYDMAIQNHNNFDGA